MPDSRSSNYATIACAVMTIVLLIVGGTCFIAVTSIRSHERNLDKEIKLAESSLEIAQKDDDRRHKKSEDDRKTTKENVLANQKKINYLLDENKTLKREVRELRAEVLTLKCDIDQ